MTSRFSLQKMVLVEGGHMGSVIQDGNGKYYYVTLGMAADGTTLGALTTGAKGQMTVQPLDAKSMKEAVALAKNDTMNSPYTDKVTFKTDSKTDQKIFNETGKKADMVNSGKENYNSLSNNCADGCENPITSATGIAMSDNIYPNTNFGEIKQNKDKIQGKLDKKRKRALAPTVTIPSGLDGYPSKKLVLPVQK